MHNVRKAAAIKKYEPLKVNGATIEEVKAELSSDEKQYTADEVDEVVFALFPEYVPQLKGPDGAGEGAPELNKELNKGTGEKAPERPKTVNILFEEYSVEPKYESITDAAGNKLGTRLASFEKLALKRTTSISQAVADELNSQSENTRLRLYPKEV